MNPKRSYLLIAGLLSLTGCGVASEEAEEPQTRKLETSRAELAFLQCPASTPAALAPAADQKLMLKLHAVGTQVYECKSAGTGFAWTLKAPAADLSLLGFKVGTHYAGPTWELLDGSTVVGARLAGATVDATAIPWLLLTAVSHGAVSGLFTHVTSIQRLSTVGGLAPATGCAAGAVGALTQVPYEADYFFYRQGPATGHNPHCG
jgi:hypothetical protein